MYVLESREYENKIDNKTAYANYALKSWCKEIKIGDIWWKQKRKRNTSSTRKENNRNSGESHVEKCCYNHFLQTHDNAMSDRQ